MRLFVAVELDEAMRAAAAQTAAELERRLESRVKASWVPPANMHLTVRFIGHVPDERVAAVLDALRPPLRVPSFEVEVGGCGVFPSGGPPRVLWIGVTDGMPSLKAMHDACNRRLAPLGYEPETRSFSAHLTVARIKDVRKSSASSIRQFARDVVPRRVRSRVTHATVFQSVTSPRGPTYTPLLHVPLEP